MNTIPTVKEMGVELESAGLVSFGKRAFNQTGSNCFEIATYLADRFGYTMPSSRQYLGGIIDDVKSSRAFRHDAPSIMYERSDVALVVREPDCFSSDAHVAFEIQGREFNYGPSSEDGFDVVMRIPLKSRNS